MNNKEQQEYNQTWRIRYPRANKNSQQKRDEQFGGFLETTKHFKKRIRENLVINEEENNERL